jgi:hypothetical protein
MGERGCSCHGGSALVHCHWPVKYRRLLTDCEAGAFFGWPCSWRRELPLRVPVWRARARSSLSRCRKGPLLMRPSGATGPRGTDGTSVGVVSPSARDGSPRTSGMGFDVVTALSPRQGSCRLGAKSHAGSPRDPSLRVHEGHPSSTDGPAHDDESTRPAPESAPIHARGKWHGSIRSRSPKEESAIPFAQRTGPRCTGSRPLADAGSITDARGVEPWRTRSRALAHAGSSPGARGVESWRTRDRVLAHAGSMSGARRVDPCCPQDRRLLCASRSPSRCGRDRPPTREASRAPERPGHRSPLRRRRWTCGASAFSRGPHPSRRAAPSPSSNRAGLTSEPRCVPWLERDTRRPGRR